MQMIKRLLKDYKDKMAMRSLREALDYFGIDHKWMSDAMLQDWVCQVDLKGYATKSNVRSAVPPSINIERELPTSNLNERLLGMSEKYPIAFKDLQAIARKCKDDVEKTENVLKLMALTYLDDETVLSRYDTYMQQYGKELAKIQ